MRRLAAHTAGQLFEGLRLLEVDLVGPNGAMGFPLSLNSEENLVVFNEVLPEAAEAVRDAKARLATLSAPIELSSDHDRLVKFLNRLIEIYDNAEAAVGGGMQTVPARSYRISWTRSARP